MIIICIRQRTFNYDIRAGICIKLIYVGEINEYLIWTNKIIIVTARCNSMVWVDKIGERVTKESNSLEVNERCLVFVDPKSNRF